MLCRATQDGWVMVESFDKSAEGNGKSLHYSCPDSPMSSMQRQKDMALKDELPRSVDAQYASGGDQRNSSTKNKEAKSK